ncbi:MAG: hypothetical protein JSV19_09875 [Phycisphaerales bacterium]|nr:MAG: hypothetical protein JSV19_09875 [Phycisphaerales bacterium]
MSSSAVRANRAAGRRPNKRLPGYALVYILAMIPLFAVAITLTYRGVVMIVNADRVLVERGNEYATLNTWLAQLRRDTRRSRTLSVRRGDDGIPDQSIVLTTADETVTYALVGSSVRRTTTGGAGPPTSGCWTLSRMSVEISAAPASGPGHVLHVTVRWHRGKRRPEEPVRRFDTSFYVGRGYAE